MFDTVVKGLDDILGTHEWSAELAGILPLSALLEFIEVPPKLHMFELMGGGPLWSWPITPAGSRLLLSDNRSTGRDPCFLDRFENSLGLVALDGRYGEQYFIASPETLRLVRDSQKIVAIQNLHENMGDDDLRLQNLEIVYVSRADTNNQHQTPNLALGSWRMHSTWFLVTSVAGWVALCGCLAATAILRLYLATAFLAIMPATGAVIFAMYGSRPRRLLVNKASSYNRLVIVAEHMNTANWIAVYGESSLVNSLLNRPLEPTGQGVPSPSVSNLLRLALRVLILGQWAMVLGASATKNWNSFFICFWVVFCIFTHAYVVPPVSQARDWLRFAANLQLHRYQVPISSRRALLNTLVSLNPDTFAEIIGPKGQSTENRTKLAEQAMRWVDPILKTSGDRTSWERATLEALNKASRYTLAEQASGTFCHKDGSCLGTEWKDGNKDRNGQDMYWKKYIVEGIYVAASIKRRAGLPGRKLADLV